MRRKTRHENLECPVAELVDKTVFNDFAETPHQEIAEAAGFKLGNNIAMIRQGKYKVPIDKAVRLAKAIEIDPANFAILCIREYLDGVSSALDAVNLLPKSDLEIGSTQAVLNALRQSGTKKRSYDPELQAKIDQLIREYYQSND